MYTQTIFKAGNSSVVSIPKHLLDELGLKTGAKVVLEKDPARDELTIKKLSIKKNGKNVFRKEFDGWLKNVLEEDKEILDELSIR